MQEPDDKLFYTSIVINNREILDDIERMMFVRKSVREIAALTETRLTATG